MIEISLSKTGKYAGKYVAIVDDCDADLAELNWHVMVRKTSCNYAVRNVWNGSGYGGFKLHRVILERIIGRNLEKGEEVDHISGDGLDNRRENLRIATRSGNNANKRLYRNNSTGFKGVYRKGKRWAAQIKHNGKNIRLGSFDTAEEAYTVYCHKADELHGEFAKYERTTP